MLKYYLNAGAIIIVLIISVLRITNSQKESPQKQNSIRLSNLKRLNKNNLNRNDEQPIQIITNSSTLNSENNIEYDTYNENNLARLKNLFMRAGMNVFYSSNDQKELDFSRSKKHNTPADEFLLSVETDEVDIFDSDINIIQGDIIVPNFNQNLSKRKKRRIIVNNQFGNPTRWPNRTIPYEFDSDATESLRKKVNAAINAWHENTCIRFEPYSSTRHYSHRSKVLIRNRGHCAARVGYVIDPFQKVSVSDVYLPEHCPLGSVIHELGHVIGFRHEHTRTDRASHIRVHYERMQSSQRAQYEIMDNGFPGYFGIYYDLYSIMHYSSQGGLLESRDPRRSFLMGQRFTLSFSDIKMANQAYSCDENCANKKNCENEGFMDSSCSCKCPEGIAGEYCETVLTKQPVLKLSSNPNLNCDFELGFCDWIQEETRDSEDWIRNTGLTKAQISFIRENLPFKTGPQIANKNTKDLFYIYLNSNDQTKAYANAILMSPQIETSKEEKRCIKFDYHMFASQNSKPESPLIGTLSLKSRNSNGDVISIWEKSGTQSDEWLKAEVDFIIKPPHTMIFFEAEAVDWRFGDIALDNIQYLKSPCKEIQQFISNSSQDTKLPEWSEWSECSKTCDGGVKKRTRLCANVSCSIESQQVEYIECNKQPCPIISEWSTWSDWSECSSSCGNGNQNRNRQCLRGKCDGVEKEIRQCFKEKCEEIETIPSWSEWSEWNQCNSTCENKQGFRTRTRECNMPLKKIYSSSGVESFKSECLGNNKEVNACEPPTNCQILIQAKWSEWNSWSPCSKSCGLNEEGIQTRTRNCLTKSLDNLSTDCLGSSEEKRPCHANVKCPSHTNEWSEWSECSVKCGNGTRTRMRQCSKDFQDFACGVGSGSELIMERKMCTSDIGCSPIKYSNSNDWSEWSEWSACSVSCGQGFSFRKRTCLDNNCDGQPQELKHCSNENECFEKVIIKYKNFNISQKVEYSSSDSNSTDFLVKKLECSNPTDCGSVETLFEPSWSKWGEWSSCVEKVKCTLGTRTRKRDCLQNNNVISNFKCFGPAFVTSLCPSSNCTTKDVDLIETNSWSQWTDWRPESNGYLIRYRKCLKYISDPFNRSNCQGEDFQRRRCFPNECSNVKMLNLSNEISLWSNWSSCSKKCGFGLKSRWRKCLKEETNCENILTEQITCSRANQSECDNQMIYLKCSFDQNEYCPLEHVTSNNPRWLLSSQELVDYFKMPNSPGSGGNFIYLNGAFNLSIKAAFKTPTYTTRTVTGQCLSFNYYKRNISSLEINKVNSFGHKQILFQNEKNHSENKWNLVLVTIKSTFDFFIEFTATTDVGAESFIAVDDIQLNPIEFCQVLSCSFDNDSCQQNPVYNQLASKQVWFEEKYQLLPKVYSSNYYYLRADVKQIQPGNKSFYGLPTVLPIYSKMCLSFFYLLNGNGSNQLKIHLIFGDNLLNNIWQETTFNNGTWKRALIDISSETSFQVAIELSNRQLVYENKSNEFIAIDNLQISYGRCNIFENHEFDDRNQRQTKLSFLSSTYNWKKKRAKRFLSNFYYPDNSIEPENCGGVHHLRFGQTLTIQSPGYPKSYSLNQRCIYLIRAPENLKIHLTMIDLNIEDNDRHDSCNDFLEIRYFNLGQPGPKFCGNLEKYNGEFSLTSFKNDVMLIFSSDWAITQKGFKLQANTCY